MFDEIQPNCNNVECGAVHTCVHLVDLVKSFQTNIYLQNLALIQPRTGLSKFTNNQPKVRKNVRKNIGVAEQFTGMFRRKAFLHWYTGEVRIWHFGSRDRRESLYISRLLDGRWVVGLLFEVATRYFREDCRFCFFSRRTDALNLLALQCLFSRSCFPVRPHRPETHFNHAPLQLPPPT